MNVLNSADAAVCWSCSAALTETALFCPHCFKMQPPSRGDYFSVFGMTPKLDLDAGALEVEFHRLSRKLHPDRFARAQENEREWSLVNTALLNDAYRTLKDPIRRTEYVLKLAASNAGGEVTARNGNGHRSEAKVPPDLLEEVFELNMQLEEMRAARKAEGTDPELRDRLRRAGSRFGESLRKLDEELRAQWGEWDAGGSEARASAERAMSALLDRRRYVANLLREITEALEHE